MTRAQCIVHRDGQVLMVKHRYLGEEWWCLPGGGVEPGEDAKMATLRELQEECGVAGILKRFLSTYTDDTGVEIITHLVNIGNQVPQLGNDPEFAEREPILAEVRWMRLDEIPERDRAYLWAAGLLCLPEFFDEVSKWGGTISYPASKSKV